MAFADRSRMVHVKGMLHCRAYVAHVKSVLMTTQMHPRTWLCLRTRLCLYFFVWMLPEFLDEVMTCENVGVHFQLAALDLIYQNVSDIEQTLFEEYTFLGILHTGVPVPDTDVIRIPSVTLSYPPG